VRRRPGLRLLPDQIDQVAERDVHVDEVHPPLRGEVAADVVDAGAGKDISSTSLQGDVYSYVFGQKGLMGGIALQGLKITRTGS